MPKKNFSTSVDKICPIFWKAGEKTTEKYLYKALENRVEKYFNTVVSYWKIMSPKDFNFF